MQRSGSDTELRQRNSISSLTDFGSVKAAAQHFHQLLPAEIEKKRLSAGGTDGRLSLGADTDGRLSLGAGRLSHVGGPRRKTSRPRTSERDDPPRPLSPRLKGETAASPKAQKDIFATMPGGVIAKVDADKRTGKRGSSDPGCGSSAAAGNEAVCEAGGRGIADGSKSQAGAAPDQFQDAFWTSAWSLVCGCCRSGRTGMGKRSNSMPNLFAGTGRQG